MRVLTVNCGSSSLKFDLLETAGAGVDRVARGASSASVPKPTPGWSQTAGAARNRRRLRGYEDAVRTALSLLKDAGVAEGVDAIGHRVVHGGPRFQDAVLIDDDVQGAIEQASELAPLHNRPALEAIRASRIVFGAAMPMVAAFDTSFFAGLPDLAREYALPKDIRERLGIRRYGFHGLAHRYMIERYRALRPAVAAPRLITLQLGSGCSITASRDGWPLDTSMGLRRSRA